MKKMAYRFVKRAFDICASLAAIIISSPFWLIIAIGIKLSSKGPIFYRADRIGKDGKKFVLYKFRSMHVFVTEDKSAGEKREGGYIANENRIFKFGGILRKTKLDELPQFVQVLQGKMSLVGPRPELMQYVSQYTGEELDILQVRPGITDFSSVEFVNLDEIVGEQNADEMYETYVLGRKNQLRIQYAHSVSFRTDVYILFKTAAVVLDKIVGFLFKHQHR